MKQLFSENSNVAWFKLAEFVGRKERERAFGVYRLLAHSLPDEALSAQLEGDLFFAFNDDRALVSYTKAARSYEKQGKWLQAALLYEHMLAHMPSNQETLVSMLKVYQEIGNDTKITSCITKLVKILVAKGRAEQAQELLADILLSNEHKILIQDLIAGNTQTYACAYLQG